MADRPNSHEFGYRLDSSVFCTLEALSLQDACVIVSLTGGAPIGDHRLISGILSG